MVTEFSTFPPDNSEERSPRRLGDGTSPSRTFDATNYKIDMNSADETFNGVALSESILGRDRNSPEENAAWASLWSIVS